MKRRHLMVTLLCLAAASAAGAQPTASTNAVGSAGATSAPFWTGVSDAASFERAMDARLAYAQTRLDQLLGSAQLLTDARGRTPNNTLRPYDDALLELDAVSSQAQLVQSVHPSKLFGVTYRPVTTVPVWDGSVEASEMLSGGRLIGRFYLDMHPRKDKYNHAAEFPIRTGLTNRQIPEAALVCNLPGGDAGDPGLMTHDDVETFLS